MFRLHEALERIDAINAGDPTMEAGEPKELLYGRRMSERLAVLEPEASEELQIAVRAQHVARWRIPRADFPDGRTGYKKWRSTLATMHADVASEVMREVGYPAESVERARNMLTKRGIKTDAEVQTLEDCACLVFLQHYFAPFALKHEEEKLIGIVRKTWAKMSKRGQEAALGVPFSPPLAALIQRALADD